MALIGNLAPLAAARQLLGAGAPVKTSITNAERVAIEDPLEQSPNVNSSNRHNAVEREPWLITCQEWMQQGRYIVCAANPTDATWNIRLRAANQPTMGGNVQHVWRSRQNVRNSFFAEPEVTFQFQSGNIMPIVLNDENGKATAQVPGGVANFYNFLSLFNATRIIDQDNGGRSANSVYIMYSSTLFPSMVLTGQWDPNGVQWPESVSDPNQIKWSASLIVHTSYPEFENADSLISAYVNSGFGKLG